MKAKTVEKGSKRVNFNFGRQFSKMAFATTKPSEGFVASSDSEAYKINKLIYLYGILHTRKKLAFVFIKY